MANRLISPDERMAMAEAHFRKAVVSGPRYIESTARWPFRKLVQMGFLKPVKTDSWRKRFEITPYARLMFDPSLRRRVQDALENA